MHTDPAFFSGSTVDNKQLLNLLQHFLSDPSPQFSPPFSQRSFLHSSLTASSLQPYPLPLLSPPVPCGPPPSTCMTHFYLQHIPPTFPLSRPFWLLSVSHAVSVIPSFRLSTFFLHRLLSLNLDSLLIRPFCLHLHQRFSLSSSFLLFSVLSLSALHRPQSLSRSPAEPAAFSPHSH